MALIYETWMSPTKLEILASWLPKQPWFEGDASQLRAVGAYRFDDPEGEVGVEGHLVTAGDETVYHVPVTYRGAPLAEGEAFLMSTTEHGVHGTRWVYDAMGDPVYRHVLAVAIAQGGTEANEQTALEGGGSEPRQVTTHVRGSGEPGAVVPDFSGGQVTSEDGISYAQTPFAALAVKRVATRAGSGPEGAEVLTVTWPGHETPEVLAIMHVGARDLDE
ncbi:CG0192-related protein [Leucobacter chinensis]|uniref:CG0192-related protein n=1 Tax=Leucobacter chinensis TaxID=2851010 RepID=UPI001C22B974|nr:hypothetical protein [Leucobacter chinensis]